MNAPTRPDILMIDASSRITCRELGEASAAIICICFVVWVLLGVPWSLIADRLAHIGVLGAMLYVVAWTKGGSG